MNKNIKKTLFFLIVGLITFLSISVFFHIKNIYENPHIVFLEGGLGNQMFQYAFGKALEKKSKRPVAFIKTFDYKRKYALGIFNLNIELIPRGKYPEKRAYIREKNAFIFEKTLFYQKSPSYFRGYFQNEKYFKDISSKIKKDFKFPKIEKTDEFNQQWLKKIKNAKNPVFIHIRRGDYIALGWELPISYYKDAIEYIQKNVKNPTFFVFGIDSDDFIKNELKLNVPYSVIGNTNHKNNEDWKDMMLMSKCKHAIIANSTFSWWAAWLGPNQKKGIVVAPDPFVLGQDEIICDNWIKIKRKTK